MMCTPNLDKYVEITKSAWPASLNADYSQADAPSARPLDNKNSRVLPDVHVSSVGPETYLDFFVWPEHMVGKLKTSMGESQLKDAFGAPPDS